MADTRPNPEGRSDTDLERICLGAALLSADSAQYLLDNTRSADFSFQGNIVIRQKMAELIGAGRSLDRNTLISALQVAGDLPKVGGETYVRSLEAAVPFGDWDMPSYVGILREYTISRRLIDIGNTIRTQAQQGVRSQDVLTQAEAYLRSLGEYSDDRGNLLDTDEIVARAGGVAKIIAPFRGVNGIKTGLRDLDAAIGGLRPAELTVIGANTSRGKSALAGQIAYNASRAVVVAYFSYEMRGDQLIRRLVSANTNVRYSDMLEDSMSDAEEASASSYVSIIADSGLHICDIRGRNIIQVKAEVRRLEARIKRKIGLVVYDHIQLMHGRRQNYSNRHSELTEISGDLAEYSLESNVPMIALSQLNRDNQKRKDGRPELGDLRECGAIEENSANTWLVHRPEYFDRNNPLLRNQVILILGKLREGRVRDIELRWNGTYMRFENSDNEGARNARADNE